MRGSILLTIMALSGCDLATTIGVDRASSVTSADKVELVTETGDTVDAVRVRVAFGRSGNSVYGDTTAATLATTAGSAHPIAVNAPVATLPLVTVDAGRETTVDLFFARTPGGEVPTFVWTIGDAEIRARLSLGSGPRVQSFATGWWFAPSYPWSTFRHQDGVITARPPRHFTVRDLRDVPEREHECDQW